MSLHLATRDDLPEIINLYSEAVTQMRADGMDQWDEIYPSEELLAEDVLSGQMYILREEDRIAAAVVLNRLCDPQYALGAWEEPDAPAVVVHRLCVNTRVRSRGIAGIVMRDLERIAAADGLAFIRLDAFPGNAAALALYRREGYRITGEVRFRKEKFLLMEKKISLSQ